MKKTMFRVEIMLTILVSVGLWGCDVSEAEGGTNTDNESRTSHDSDSDSDSTGESDEDSDFGSDSTGESDKEFDFGSDSTGETDETGDTLDPDCGPADEALIANEFGSALWGGENVYLTVQYFHYFGECEYRCVSDEKTLMWRLDPEGNKTELFSFPAGRSALYDVTPDGSRFAVSDPNLNTLVVMDGEGQELASFDKAIYSDISLSPDGTRALLKSLGKTASDAIWTMVTFDGGALVDMPAVTQAKPRSVSWSPDGNRLAYIDSSKTDGPLTILDLELGESIQLDVGETQNYWKVVWRADGGAVYYVAPTSEELTASGIGTGWYQIDAEEGALPVFVTGAVGAVLSSSGDRTLYLENSWLHVQDIVLDKSVYTVTGTGGNCC